MDADLNITAQQVIDAFPGIAYLLDAEGRIVCYGRRQWDKFAADNNGNKLLGDDEVLGHRLEEFMSGGAVRDFWVGCMDKIRTNQMRNVTLPFRCDAPNIRREMRMDISGVYGNGQLLGYLYCSTTLLEQERPPIDLLDFDRLRTLLADRQTLPFVNLCSFCERVKSDITQGEGDGWVEAEDYYRLGGHADVNLSHGICPACHKTHADVLDEATTRTC